MCVQVAHVVLLEQLYRWGAGGEGLQRVAVTVWCRSRPSGRHFMGCC